jgi:hypothetical protein
MYSSVFLTEPLPSAAILARYDDGSPALMESKVGKGLSLLYTSTLGDSWNTLPLNPVYLPMLHQLVKYAASAAQEKNLYVIGETVPLEHILPMTPEDMMSEKIMVNDPKGEPSRVVDGLISIAQPGFYEIKSGRHIKYIAANPSTTESDLRKVDPKELVAAVTKGPATPPDGAEKPPDSVSADTVEKRQSLWWFLLLAALLLFFTETILANRKKG